MKNEFQERVYNTLLPDYEEALAQSLKQPPPPYYQVAMATANQISTANGIVNTNNNIVPSNSVVTNDIVITATPNNHHYPTNTVTHVSLNNRHFQGKQINQQ